MNDNLIEKIIEERSGEWSKKNDISDVIKKTIKAVLELTSKNQIYFQETPEIVFITHLVSIVGRLVGKEEPFEGDEEMFSEIGEDSVKIAEGIADTICSNINIDEIPKGEIMLIATHIEFAKYMEKNDDSMENKERKMEKVKIVIGHRFGKGKNVAEGVRQAGGEPILIEGMAADMKVGQYMKENEAHLGISFCGGGGGGALAAQNKYGYKAKYDLRTVPAGIGAVMAGYEALGFGIMDTEELGREITLAYIKKLAKDAAK